DTPCGRSPPCSELLGALQNVLVDIQRSTHLVIITHQSSDVKETGCSSSQPGTMALRAAKVRTEALFFNSLPGFCDCGEAGSCSLTFPETPTCALRRAGFPGWISRKGHRYPRTATSIVRTSRPHRDSRRSHSRSRGNKGTGRSGRIGRCAVSGPPYPPCQRDWRRG